MKKRQGRKLTITRETVVQLNKLATVAGGFSSDETRSCGGTCEDACTFTVR